MPLNLDHIEALARAGQAPDPSTILRLITVARAAVAWRDEIARKPRPSDAEVKLGRALDALTGAP